MCKDVRKATNSPFEFATTLLTAKGKQPLRQLTAALLHRENRDKPTQIVGLTELSTGVILVSYYDVCI